METLTLWKWHKRNDFGCGDTFAAVEKVLGPEFSRALGAVEAEGPDPLWASWLVKYQPGTFQQQQLEDELKRIRGFIREFYVAYAPLSPGLRRRRADGTVVSTAAALREFPQLAALGLNI